MDREISGKRIAITGASSGIGRALAEQAARAGAWVAVNGRSVDKLDELCQSLHGAGLKAISVPGDVTRDQDRQRILQNVKEHWGGLDVLINNAGVASFGHFATSSEEIMRQVMEVNFFAPAEMIRLAIPMLTEGRQPAIVNVASMCGRRGMPAWPEYSASKFALCGLTEALRGEMARFDIDVLLIVPGLTRSDFRQHFLRDEGRMRIKFNEGLTPEDVARQVLNALKKNKTETVLGREARWLLRTHRFAPGFVDWLMNRRVKQLYQEAPTSPPAQ